MNSVLFFVFCWVKLRRCGAGGAGYIKTLLAPAECSARRWEKYSVWRTNLTNQIVMLAYVYGGYSPAQIFDFYYKFNLSDWLLARYEGFVFYWCFYDHNPKEVVQKQVDSKPLKRSVFRVEASVQNGHMSWEKLQPS